MSAIIELKPLENTKQVNPLITAVHPVMVKWEISPLLLGYSCLWICDGELASVSNNAEEWNVEE